MSTKLNKVYRVNYISARNNSIRNTTVSAKDSRDAALKFMQYHPNAMIIDVKLDNCGIANPNCQFCSNSITCVKGSIYC